MKAKTIRKAERIAAYKVANGLPNNTPCEIDGSIVNVKGEVQSYNWVLEFDSELREVFKDDANEYLDQVIVVGGRRWIIMST